MNKETPPSLKDVMRRVAATVCVISFDSPDGPQGITVSSFTSVSMEPPTVLYCVNRIASVYMHLKDVKSYCVNILHANQTEVSQYFVARADDAEPVAWGTIDGVPVLKDAQCNIVCESKDRTAVGTHDVFFGEVKSVAIRDDVAPLGYLDGRYCQFIRDTQTSE